MLSSVSPPEAERRTHSALLVHAQRQRGLPRQGEKVSPHLSVLHMLTKDEEIVFYGNRHRIPHERPSNPMRRHRPTEGREWDARRRIGQQCCN
eukprot:scaffold3029_cov33-Tisochrysis_lutea.AAC.3